MLTYLHDRATEGKLRLFAVACCRRIWHLLPDQRSRGAVDVAERYADRRATDEELERASEAAYAVWEADMKRASKAGKWDSRSPLPYYCASAAAYTVAVPIGWWGSAPAFVAPDEIIREGSPNSETEGAAQCVLLRDIFGTLFHPISLDRAWLTSNAISLAQAIYEERAFDRLPILADALEEAGCTNAEILGHCREAGVHVRGCWLIDLLLDPDNWATGNLLRGHLDA
jgi:hypothetical protein